MRARLIRIPLFVFFTIGFTAESLLCVVPPAHAQSGYGNPFNDYEEEALQNQKPVYNGLADAAAALFGPEQMTVQAPPPAIDPWQDLNQVDPYGNYGKSYDDYAAKKVEEVVNAPLPKKKPFNDPLDDFKKDPGTGALFEEPNRRGGLSE